MTIINLSQGNFDQTIASHDCVVVDFWADWCGPCHAFASIFEEVSKQFPEVLFAKVDIEQEKNLADDFQVRSIPYLMIFRREFAVFAQSGTQTKTSLHKLITDAKALDIETLRKQIPSSD